MNSSELEFKPIRNALIKGLLFIIVSIILFFLIGEELLNSDSFSSSLAFSFSIAILVAWICGYLICWRAAYKYAKYKGYPGYWGFIAGFLNVFGLSFLFLLDSKRKVEVDTAEDNEFRTLNLWSFLVAYFAIPILLYPAFIFGLALGGKLKIITALSFLSDVNINYIVHIVTCVVVFWYFYKKFIASKISFNWLLGEKKKINILLPISLAVAQYFFSWGFNVFTLYGISFIYPRYLKYWINQDQVSTAIGFIGFFIGAVIFAPIWEEIIFRGILFQKIASTKSIFWGIIYSSLLFAIIHFRYDLIPLFIIGIITALLYYKTKQVIAPILLHFFYNLIAVSHRIYNHYFAVNNNLTGYNTVADYQEYFLNHLNSNILFIALSTPYLIYFIYKNFPRHNDLSKLPYYTNKKQALEN